MDSEHQIGNRLLLTGNSVLLFVSVSVGGVHMCTCVNVRYSYIMASGVHL